MKAAFKPEVLKRFADPALDPATSYRQMRDVVVKRCRAIATRFENTACNYLALVRLACVWLWLSA